MTAPLNEQEKALLSQVEPWISQHKEQLIGELAQWVAIPSISRADLAKPGAPFGPECVKVLDHALNLAKQAGFRTEEHEGYAGSIIFGDHAQDIGLVSHLDVVPAGENWTYPPFSLTRRDDFLIGRGVSDNKGPAILDLYLLKLIRDLKIPLHHNLRIIYGLAEETNMADLRWFAEKGPVPRLSIVTDGKFPVNFAQKGQISFTLEVKEAGVLAGLSAGNASNSVPAHAEILLDIALTTALEQKIAALQGPATGRISARKTDKGVLLIAKGKAGHAAFPDPTLNAAPVLLSALVQLELLSTREHQLASSLARLFVSPFGEGANLALEDTPSGKLTLNGGYWQSSTENTLLIHSDIRYPVTTKGPEILNTLQRQLAEWGGDIVIQAALRDVPPFYWPESDPVLRLLQDTWNQITERHDAPYSMGGVTHSKVLPRAITFGPGYARTAENAPDFLPEGHGLPHGADETLHLPTLLNALPVYLLALVRLDRHLAEQS
nr:Sapep family Mn(2+)-dependent dipeptidase [Rouxiella chamberiensis]